MSRSAPVRREEADASADRARRTLGDDVLRIDFAETRTLAGPSVPGASSASGVIRGPEGRAVLRRAWNPQLRFGGADRPPRSEGGTVSQESRPGLPPGHRRRALVGLDAPIAKAEQGRAERLRTVERLVA